jgi:hypothetical protein
MKYMNEFLMFFMFLLAKSPPPAHLVNQVNPVQFLRGMKAALRASATRNGFPDFAGGRKILSL